jgi:hypothetical protein
MSVMSCTKLDKNGEGGVLYSFLNPTRVLAL